MLKLIKGFFLLLLLQIVISCKTVNVKYNSMSAKDYIQTNKNNATALYEQGNIKEAVELLNRTVDNFLEERKYLSIIEDIYLNLITWQIEIGEESKAKVRASYFLKKFPKSAKVPLIINLFDAQKMPEISVEEKSEIKETDKIPQNTVQEKTETHNVETPQALPTDTNNNSILDEILKEEDKKILDNPQNTPEEPKKEENKNDIFDEAKKSDTVIMNDLLNNE